MFLTFNMTASDSLKLLSKYLFLIFIFSTCVRGDENYNDKCLNNIEAFPRIILSMTERLTNEIEKENNFIFSPLSISAALAMLYIGARGNTKTQISDALHYNISSNKCPDLKILEGFRDLFLSLDVSNDIISTIIANCVFIQTGFAVSPDYLFKVQEYFNSEVKYENFAYEKETTMRHINKYVSDKTNTHIRKLLNEPLDTMTVMVLANVIYFKGLWEHPFSNAWNSYFHTANGTSKVVPFMKLENTLNYYYDNTIDYSFLELPYVGGNITMLIVLPRNNHELPKFQLNSKSLCKLRNNLEMHQVIVGLPKVQLTYSRELSKDMSNFGMTDIFSDKADLTGMRAQNDLHVSLMIHKAIIEIDEKGSRASAVSGIGIDVRRRPTHTSIFWANHPFLFYIIDKNKETVLFAGRVTDP